MTTIAAAAAAAALGFDIINMSLLTEFTATTGSRRSAVVGAPFQRRRTGCDGFAFCFGHHLSNSICL